MSGTFLDCCPYISSRAVTKLELLILVSLVGQLDPGVPRLVPPCKGIQSGRMPTQV